MNDMELLRTYYMSIRTADSDSVLKELLTDAEGIIYASDSWLDDALIYLENGLEKGTDVSAWFKAILQLSSGLNLDKEKAERLYALGILKALNENGSTLSGFTSESGAAKKVAKALKSATGDLKDLYSAEWEDVLRDDSTRAKMARELASTMGSGITEADYKKYLDELSKEWSNTKALYKAAGYSITLYDYIVTTLSYAEVNCTQAKQLRSIVQNGSPIANGLDAVIARCEHPVNIIADFAMDHVIKYAGKYVKAGTILEMSEMAYFSIATELCAKAMGAAGIPSLDDFLAGGMAANTAASFGQIANNKLVALKSGYSEQTANEYALAVSAYLSAIQAEIDAAKDMLGKVSAAGIVDVSLDKRAKRLDYMLSRCSDGLTFRVYLERKIASALGL